MSTAYNRRRGAKANRHRKPRTCQHREEPKVLFHDIVDHENGLIEGMTYMETNQRCIRLADGASRYCTDHRFRSPALPEGPISRRLRLEHQARQSAEDGRLPMTARRKIAKAQTGVKLSGAQKMIWRKVRAAAAMQTFLQALLGYSRVEKWKKQFNPWAK